MRVIKILRQYVYHTHIHLLHRNKQQLIYKSNLNLHQIRNLRTIWYQTNHKYSLNLSTDYVLLTFLYLNKIFSHFNMSENKFHSPIFTPDTRHVQRYIWHVQSWLWPKRCKVPLSTCSITTLDTVTQWRARNSTLGHLASFWSSILT